MSGDSDPKIVRPGFAGSNLIASLEQLLDMAKAGELEGGIFVAVNKEGSISIGGVSGDLDRMPLMTLIAELEHQKHM